MVQEVLKQDGNGPVDEKIWSCISCNMCMERCNSNVNFTEFVRALRHKAVEEGAEIQYSHGGAPQTIMRIMAHRDIRQNRMNWLPDDIEIQKQCDTDFFVGCTPYFDILFSDLGLKTVEGTKGALRLLNYAHIPVTLLSNERCCGRDLLLAGDVDGFIALAQANMREFKRKGIKRIITSCPECYYTLKVDYPRFLDDWNINVLHITEVIAPLVENGQLTLGTLKKKVTYHDPCTLGRYSRIFEQPRSILISISELEMIEMADNRERALCCGASPWINCSAINKRIQKERLAQAGATNADILVTACPKCQIHLRCAQKNSENNDICQIEIRDIFDLASQSLLAQEVN
jgi:Fe-S oxidoreductase